MKPKFKPGDVVEFNLSCRESCWYPTWLRINGPGPHVISGEATNSGYHLAHISGHPIEWHEDFITPVEGGVGDMWFERNEFLTAVHKAQEQTNLKRKGDVSI